MRVGVLFSGGKDSCAALALARAAGHEVVCLLSVASQNPDSYMFHTPNINLTRLQAEAIGLPIIVKETPGEKEEELQELKALIEQAVEEHTIEGVVTGAVESVYQASRVQRICAELGLYCFNPLWKIDQHEYLEWLIGAGFEVFVGGVAAYPFEGSWLGRRITNHTKKELYELESKYQVSPVGEGGEFETFVAYAPGWKSRIIIDTSESKFAKNAGRWIITKTRFEDLLPEKNPAEPSQPAEGNKLLIINLCSDKLSEREFIHPIRHVVPDSFVRKPEEVGEDELQRATAVILSGSPLIDDGYLEKTQLFDWMKSFEKPVLGICLGMEILAQLHGAEVKEMDEFEIGMTKIITLKTAAGEGFLDEDCEAYCLHHNTMGVSESFEILARSKCCVQAIKHKTKPQYGVQFHPEVRNKEIIEKFLSL